MANSPLRNVIRQLRTAALRDGGAMTDGQLLKCFITHRDDAAFAALVRRHGPMVWGVCRRLIGNHHDAEDAFQATFLVLVRKAPSIVPREMVANWLYGVAHNTAVKARAMTNRKRVRERQVIEMPEKEAAEQGPWRDLQPVLDNELSRLPDLYRIPIVLCDLEGRTRKEAAQQLGVPEGTLSARLSRARAMLAKRLAQKGLVLSGGALAGIVWQNAAAAGAPALVLESTIKAATLLPAGNAAGLISAKAAALTQVISVAFSPDGKFLAAGGYQGEIAIVDLAAGKVTRTLNTSSARACLAFSPDSKQLASCGARDVEITVWDLGTGKARPYKASPDELGTQNLAFSPDGQLLAGDGWVNTAGQKKWGARVWDVDTGELLHAWPSLGGFAFTPDSKRLALLHDEKTIRLRKTK